jgi:hypothetical protein
MARSKKAEAMAKKIKGAAEIEADKLLAELLESEPGLRAAHDALLRGEGNGEELAEDMIRNFKQRLKN